MDDHIYDIFELPAYHRRNQNPQLSDASYNQFIYVNGGRGIIRKRQTRIEAKCKPIRCFLYSEQGESRAATRENDSTPNRPLRANRESKIPRPFDTCTSIRSDNSKPCKPFHEYNGTGVATAATAYSAEQNNACSEHSEHQLCNISDSMQCSVKRQEAAILDATFSKQLRVCSDIYEQCLSEGDFRDCNSPDTSDAPTSDPKIVTVIHQPARPASRTCYMNEEDLQQDCDYIEREAAEQTPAKTQLQRVISAFGRVNPGSKFDSWQGAAASGESALKYECSLRNVGETDNTNEPNAYHYPRRYKPCRRVRKHAGKDESSRCARDDSQHIEFDVWGDHSKGLFRNPQIVARRRVEKGKLVGNLNGCDVYAKK